MLGITGVYDEPLPAIMVMIFNMMFAVNPYGSHPPCVLRPGGVPVEEAITEGEAAALRGEKLTAAEASALLRRVVQDYGPFPIGLLLAFHPAPPILPHPQAIDVKDASGRKIPVVGFLRSEGAESVELIIDVGGADLRWMELVVPIAPATPQHIRIDLRG